MSDVFNSAQTEVTVDQLVGEGRKFASVDDLARGKVEADRTIEARNRELQEMREELNRLLEEKRIKEQNAHREPSLNNTPREPDRPVVEEPNEDLATRIRNELRAAQEEDLKNQNLGQVTSKLIDLYGSEEKANEVIKTKAAELGLSVDFLRDVAARSPKAFFAQLGVSDNTPTPPTATRGDVNTAGVGDTLSTTGVKEGTYKFYEQIRKTDPKLYFSAQVQNKMFADAKRLGDAFYN